MKSSWYGLSALFLCALWTGCQSYSPEPLDPGRIFEEVERTRQFLLDEMEPREDPGASRSGDTLSNGSGEIFTLRRAAELMSLHSPELREVRAEYRSAQGLADVKTPFPNPSIEAGPKIGSNLEEGSSHRVQPFVGLGFTLPLSGRLGREDDVNSKSAEQAFLRVLVKHRRLYLELRTAYTEWVLARARLRAREGISLSVVKALELTRQLVEAGAAGALDVGQMELELHQTRIELLESRQAAADAEAELAGLIGVHPRHFDPVPEDALPELPETLPDFDLLKRAMVRNGLDLAVIRGEYEVAESRLKLEIIKQYPDLELGAVFEKEPGETSRVFELTIGIDLPLFDRNQQGIAEARLHREALREKYAAAANRALARLEHACQSHEISRQKMEWLREKALPRARANVDAAKQSMAAARIDSLKYLEAERALNAVLIDAVESELELRRSLIDIELAVGRPFWLFPSEEEISIPPLPDNLDQPTSSGDAPEEKALDDMESGS